ncbi:MAG: helix-hairpin-helix domain-containing protein [Candidatus Kuenenia sp.]|nr:helix-hairpin-helix domain-containing protein [Candidatus Kuenenia hertensis]
MESPQKLPNKTSPAKKQLIVIFFLTTSLFIGIVIKAGRDYHWWQPETEIVSTLTPGDIKTKIDINEAPWHELLLLPKVGEVKARAIVAYRKKHGRFNTLDELRQIKGIGNNIIELLKDCVIVGTGSVHASDN